MRRGKSPGKKNQITLIFRAWLEDTKPTNKTENCSEIGKRKTGDV